MGSTASWRTQPGVAKSWWAGHHDMPVGVQRHHCPAGGAGGVDRNLAIQSTPQRSVLPLSAPHFPPIGLSWRLLGKTGRPACHRLHTGTEGTSVVAGHHAGGSQGHRGSAREGLLHWHPPAAAGGCSLPGPAEGHRHEGGCGGRRGPAQEDRVHQRPPQGGATGGPLISGGRGARPAAGWAQRAGANAEGAPAGDGAGRR